MTRWLTAGLLTVPCINASPYSQSFECLKRQANSTASPLVVDLGYERYEGVHNFSTGVNVFKGIRYASPPTGPLRWQAPQPPVSNRTSILHATDFAPSCLQAPFAIGPGLPLTSGSEDCLFLNVYTPQDALNLPVLVWIHGGGYGQGNGQQDMSHMINANNNDFIGVSIQYRDEVFRSGVVNAGFLDQQLALKWIQSYISLFGGNPDQVTISGVSAGGGSVMLHDIAYGGSLGTSLFRNSISASPYLQRQWGYKDFVPTQNYYAFATHAGCPPTWAHGNSSKSIFDCLVSQDIEILKEANAIVSASGVYGTWAFQPVTDGFVIQSTPSEALSKHRLNGVNHLSGNNAEEAVYFADQRIDTEEKLIAWLQLSFPLFTNETISTLLSYYPSSNASDTLELPKYATSGISGATAINVSQSASGQQQRADNIYAETTIICPSYWLAEGYNMPGHKGYKYQYSVPWAAHGADSSAYFGEPTENQGPGLIRAFERMWGNFVMTGNPSISGDVAHGLGSNSTAITGLEDWPPFTVENPSMANLNQTGGTAYTYYGAFNVTQYKGLGLENSFSLVDGYTWEGGRGKRCDFWKSVAGLLPE